MQRPCQPEAAGPYQCGLCTCQWPVRHVASGNTGTAGQLPASAMANLKANPSWSGRTQMKSQNVVLPRHRSAPLPVSKRSRMLRFRRSHEPQNDHPSGAGASVRQRHVWHQWVVHSGSYIATHTVHQMPRVRRVKCVRVCVRMARYVCMRVCLCECV